MDFSKLPYHFENLKFLKCQNIFPDWRKISYQIKSIEIKNCSFKDWSPTETEILVSNFTKFNRKHFLSIDSELLPTCLRLESGSFLSQFSIHTRVEEPACFHLILEEPTHIYGEKGTYNSITLLASGFDSEKSKDSTNLLKDIERYSVTYPRFQHLTLVIDVADGGITDYFNNAARQLKKYFPQRRIHIYSAIGVIEHFAKTFATPKIQPTHVL